MNTAGPDQVAPVDAIQDRLSSFASALEYDGLGVEATRAAKIRIVDTFGALLGGMNGRPCRIARQLAKLASTSHGASVFGTSFKTTPDMAAFANGTGARYVEMNDAYHIAGRRGGHPSDIIMPAMAAAESSRSDGRTFITSVVAGYETYLRVIDAVEIPGFDYTNFVCLGSAVAAAKAMRLNKEQISNCIALAVVPNNALRQGAIGHLSMWKVMASGQAGRAGVFAALLAKEGVQGPSMPFEGKEGWCNYVSRNAFSLGAMGGNGVPFKVQDTIIKLRPVRYATIPAVLAAERIAPVADPQHIREVLVESFKRAVEGIGEHHWNPRSRETATHSIPFAVAAALVQGRVTPQTFDEATVNNETIRVLMKKIRVEENRQMSVAHQSSSQHYARVTVITACGERITGTTGGEYGDLSDKPGETQITDKFRTLADRVIAPAAAATLLERLWNLENVADLGEITSQLAHSAGH